MILGSDLQQRFHQVSVSFTVWTECYTEFVFLRGGFQKTNGKLRSRIEFVFFCIVGSGRRTTGNQRIRMMALLCWQVRRQQTNPDDGIALLAGPETADGTVCREAELDDAARPLPLG